MRELKMTSQQYERKMRREEPQVWALSRRALPDNSVQSWPITAGQLRGAVKALGFAISLADAYVSRRELAERIAQVEDWLREARQELEKQVS